MGETSGVLLSDPKATEAVLDILSKYLNVKVDMKKIDQKVKEVEKVIHKIENLQSKLLAPQTKKKGKEGGRFAIIIDPSKCKGCAECVTVCDDLALKMIPKSEEKMDTAEGETRTKFKDFDAEREDAQKYKVLDIEIEIGPEDIINEPQVAE